MQQRWKQDGLFLSLMMPISEIPEKLQHALYIELIYVLICVRASSHLCNDVQCRDHVPVIVDLA